jgi:hypothetical protein
MAALEYGIDKQGGPNWSRTGVLHRDCGSRCNDEVYFTSAYTMAHFSKFIRPALKS